MISDLRLVCANDSCIALSDDFNVLDRCHVDRCAVRIDAVDDQIVASENVIVNEIVLLDHAVVDDDLGIGGNQDRLVNEKVLSVKNDGFFAFNLVRIGKAERNGLAVADAVLNVIANVKNRIHFSDLFLCL